MRPLQFGMFSREFSETREVLIRLAIVITDCYFKTKQYFKANLLVSIEPEPATVRVSYFPAMDFLESFFNSEPTVETCQQKSFTNFSATYMVFCNFLDTICSANHMLTILVKLILHGQLNFFLPASQNFIIAVFDFSGTIK